MSTQVIKARDARLAKMPPYTLFTLLEEIPVKVISNWEDSLIWGPSQCYLPIKVADKEFEIYLRWRHQNPWTADLIEYRGGNDIWHSLNISPWTADELNQCKRQALRCAEELIRKLLTDI